MTEDKIVQNAFNIALSVNKKAQSRKDLEIEGVHDLYKDSVDMYEAIQNHSKKGKFPKKLFKFRSPNQTEKEAQYIENNYKQHTLPVFVDYVSTITRPFGDGNWSIEYSEDANVYKQSNQSFQTYVEKGLPIYGSLENFIKFILPTIKSIDANGFVGIRPRYIDYIEDNEGELKVDDTKLFEPTIYYYCSDDVIEYNEQYCLFLSEEESRVTYMNKIVEEGAIFELYTKEAVYFFKQIGNKIDNNFEIITFYKHDLGYLPTIQLMGIPSIEDDKILWQSPFIYSVDLLDLVLVNSNWLQASINKCVFPNVVMLGNPCDFKDVETGTMCDSGSLYINGVTKSCPSCNGSGLKSRLSPLGTLLISPSTKFGEGETNSTQDPLRFISPDVTTLEFLKSKIDNDTDKAKKILHLQTSNSNVQGSDNLTATGMAIDAKAMYSFIKPISDQIFTIYEFCLRTIGFERYGELFVEPQLSYPKTFDFKSSEDYLADISKAIANNLPPSFIQTILMQYINAFYGDSSISTKIFKLISQVDRLFALSQDEINMKLAKGTVAKWEDILHTSILSFVNDAISEDAEFLNKDFATQKEILINKSKETINVIEGKPVEDMLTAITPIGNDAANNLKGSVGGLTGMIEIAKAVSSGLYDLEAAVALVSDRFGLTEEEAKKQLGTPQVITSVTAADQIAKLT
jgi:hypothetical protein